MKLVINIVNKQQSLSTNIKPCPQIIKSVLIYEGNAGKPTCLPSFFISPKKKRRLPPDVPIKLSSTKKNRVL